MKPGRAAGIALIACGLAACVTTGPPAPPVEGAGLGGLFGGLTKAFSTAAEVRDSVYLAVDRKSPVPKDYGLYTVVLARTADRHTLQLLTELFKATSPAGEAALARENLNLILLPTRNAAEATRALAAARSQPAEAAGVLMQKSYDYGQASLLMASVCHPARGTAVMAVCGSQAPEGPLLVSALRPLDGAASPGQALLIVNLSNTPPQAVREVLAAYRRQILRKDFADRAELDGWRLWALNHVLDAAQLLPGISKAYAGGK